MLAIANEPAYAGIGLRLEILRAGQVRAVRAQLWLIASVPSDAYIKLAHPGALPLRISPPNHLLLGDETGTPA